MKRMTLARELNWAQKIWIGRFMTQRDGVMKIDVVTAPKNAIAESQKLVPLCDREHIYTQQSFKLYLNYSKSIHDLQ